MIVLESMSEPALLDHSKHDKIIYWVIIHLVCISGIVLHFQLPNHS